MRPAVDHIDVTVRDLRRAERFYDRLLPLLGFDLSAKEYRQHRTKTALRALYTICLHIFRQIAQLSLVNREIDSAQSVRSDKKSDCATRAQSLCGVAYTAVPEHEYQIVEYHSGAFSFGIVSERRAYAGDKVTRRRAGSLHHLAFRAESREEVDAVYRRVLEIPGALVVRPPQYYPEYCPDYYAFFIKDTEGIEYEVVHFDRQGYFPVKK